VVEGRIKKLGLPWTAEDKPQTSQDLDNGQRGTNTISLPADRVLL
jgi:hypothetical protein